MLRLSGDGTSTAHYDPATGVLSENRAQPDDADHPSDALPDGWYRRLGGTLVVFYGAAGRVWLRIGDTTRVCTSPDCVDWARQANGMARLSLLDDLGVVASIVYFGGDPSGVPPELDFTMTDTEDFDFGEFVHRKLDNETNLRRIFGHGLGFDASAMTATLRAVLDAFPTPRQNVDVGPLARMSPVDYSAMPNPAPFDAELRKFLDGLENAPAIGWDEWTEPYPPVMPLALGLSDHERAVLQIFAVRTAQRAAADLSAAHLPSAVVAAVLGGLDCDCDSSSFKGARRAITAIVDVVIALGLSPNDVIGPPCFRVGDLGRTRVEMAVRSRLAK